MTGPIRIIGHLLTALAITGCSATYAFVPVTSTPSSIAGQPATDYAIPSPAPHGHLRIASFGINELGVRDAPDQHASALHIRVLVTNRSEQAWALDAREQQVALQGHAIGTPALATASPGTGSSPPVVTIAAGATRFIDLFFPLPADMQEPGDIPAFELISRVLTDQGLVVETTPFERVEVDDYPNGGPSESGFGPYAWDYWDSPFWYNAAYVGFYGGVPLPWAYRGGPGLRVRGWGGHGRYGGGHGGFHGGFHGGRR